MDLDTQEEQLLRSVAIQNANAILLARERAERQLVEAKQTLERRTQELAAERERLQVTLSSIGDAVISTDPEGRVAFLNAAAEVLTGWPQSEAAGLPVTEIFRTVDEHTRKPSSKPMDVMLRRGKSMSLDNPTVLISRNGRETPIEESVSPIRDAAGNVMGAVIVFHDVAMRRRSEEILRRSHAQIEALIDSSPVGILLVDRDFCIQKVNSRALPAFGEFSNVIGRSFTEFVHLIWPEPVAEEIVARFRHTMETGEPFFQTGFTDVRRDRGTREYYDWELHRITFADGQHGVACYFTDVSPHVRAEEALRVSEERFRAVFSQASLGMALASADGKFEQVNPRIAEIFGYPPDELLRMTVLDITHPDDLKVSRERIKDLLAGRISNYTLEKRYIRKDGSLVWSRTSVTLLKERLGESHRMLGFVEDITERKHAELISSRLAAIVESSDDAIISLTLEGIITTWNQSAERTFGYSAGEVVGKSINIIIPPDLTEEEPRIIHRIQAGERVNHYETIRVRKDGSRLNVSLTVSPIYDAQHRVVGVSKISRDITERKRAEEALRESEQRFAVLADAAPVMIWVAGVDGRCIHLNRAWLNFVGHPLEEELGDGWAKNIHPEDRERCLNSYEAAFNARQPFELEWRLRHHSGEYRWILDRGTPRFGPSKTFQGYIGGCTDIHDQKQSEEKLERVVAERTAALREVIGELEAFSYSISHDLRAPLRAMQSFAGILQEEYGARLDEEGRQHLHRITRAAERLDQLIKDVLTYSRIGRSELRLEPIDLNVLLREVLESYPAFRSSRMEIQLCGPFPDVLGTESLLTQCISNLIGNAVKFVEAGTKPVVQIFAVRSPGPEEFVRLCFRDNGIGIPKESQKRVFGIFNRLHNQYDGTGIGLAIVKKSVERLGGNVGLDSTPGQGSTFWLDLKPA